MPLYLLANSLVRVTYELTFLLKPMNTLVRHYQPWPSFVPTRRHWVLRAFPDRLTDTQCWYNHSRIWDYPRFAHRWFQVEPHPFPAAELLERASKSGHLWYLPTWHAMLENCRIPVFPWPLRVEPRLDDMFQVCSGHTSVQQLDRVIPSHGTERASTAYQCIRHLFTHIIIIICCCSVVFLCVVGCHNVNNERINKKIFLAWGDGARDETKWRRWDMPLS